MNKSAPQKKIDANFCISHYPQRRQNYFLLFYFQNYPFNSRPFLQVIKNQIPQVEKFINPFVLNNKSKRRLYLYGKIDCMAYDLGRSPLGIGCWRLVWIIDRGSCKLVDRIVLPRNRHNQAHEKLRLKKEIISDFYFISLF